MDSLCNFRLAYYYGGSLGRAIKSSISLQEPKVLLLKARLCRNYVQCRKKFSSVGELNEWKLALQTN